MRARAPRHPSTALRASSGAKARAERFARPAFTLVELLVVVVLVGLAASVVTVQLRGSTDRARLRAATLRIEQTLRLARHRAMTHHESLWLVFRLDSDRYCLAFAEQGKDGSNAWHTLDNVSVRRAAVQGQEASASGQEEFAIRITPTGASLPWALELWTSSARRVVWTDGISGRLGFVDDVGLHELRWEDSMERAE